MDFKELNYVLTIAEERSFSRAARKLFMAQPSLSQYVKRLEESLGFDLFKRSANPLALTPEGERYVEYARRMITLREEMRLCIEDIASGQTGSIVLGMSITRGTALLPYLLPYFHKRHPGIDISLAERPPGGSVNLEKLLSENKLDLCILSPPISRRDITCEKLYDEPMLLAAPPGLVFDPDFLSPPECGMPNLDLRCLRDERFILSSEHTRMRVEAEKICRKFGFKPKAGMETNSVETAQKMVSAGYGFTFVPELCRRHHREPLCPKFYTFCEPTYTWPLYIAYRKGGYMSKAAGIFLEETKRFFEAYTERRKANPFDADIA